MKKKDIRDVFCFLILTTILLCTSIYVKVPNPFSIGNAAKVSVSDFCLLFLTFYSFILILKKKKYKDKRFLMFLLFAVSFVILTIIRIYVTRSFNLSIALTEMITFAFFFSYLVKLNIFKKEVVLMSFSAVLTFTNIQALLCILVSNVNLRSLPLMGNVNIYTSYVFISAPFLIYEYQNYKNKFTKLLLYGNLTMCLVLFPLTGSRVASAGILFLLIAVYVLIYKKIYFSIIKKLVIISFFAILPLVYFYSTNVAIKTDVNRTLSFLTVLKSGDSGETDTSSKENNGENTESISDNSGETDTSSKKNNGDITDSENKEVIDNSKNVVEQNNTDTSESTLLESTPNLRKDLLVRSIQLLQENPLLGTGRPTIFVNKVGNFTIHNYIFEVFLNYGLIVGCMYFVVALIPLFTILKNLKKRTAITKTLVFSVGYLLVFIYSMVEPILSSKIVVLLPLWSYMIYIQAEDKTVDEK